MLTPAVPDDLPEAAALINLSYRGEAAARGWANENDYISGQRITPEDLAADLADRPRARLMLRRDQADGELLGCVWIEPLESEVGYLGLLTVRPDLQDRRLGRSILEEAEDLLRREGSRIARMTVVHLRSGLIAWYQRRGYVPTGETEPFPQPALARRDLHLVVLQKRL
jgi:GNAT superfamily N-acetyltransferase